ncbi:LTA synthase family protein [Emticicia sp. SJ17W-69]|uniref:LTA synthase family protein n=1 Tax=Emticicia sp. SJ17W-69 TaxID=3421657 RepID=UPI003EB69A0D
MNLLLWLKRMSWLIVIYFLLRILFFIFNFKSFQNVDYQQIIFAFLYGLKFDLSAIFISNSLLTICSLLPFRFVEKVSYQNFLKYLYWIPNSIFFWTNIADFEYYKFIGRRTIFEIFSIMADALEQSGSLIGSYWYLILIWIVIIGLFVKFTPNKVVNKKVFHPIIGSLIWLFSLGLTILIFRGGFQEKPLRINQAFVQNNGHLGNLTLNTTFTFLTTIDAKGTEKVAYFADNQEVISLIKRDRSNNFEPNPTKQNVVVIILESFGREYMGYQNPYKGYTPFLDSLSKSGVFMNNCFANGRESIIAVPAITSAIPQLIDEPFITSSYQSNKFIGLGSFVKQKDYVSSFFHGARNGSMGFEGFSQLAGFDKYFGLNEYPKGLIDNDFDKNWGIFDEPYLQYFANELSKETKPFVSCIFTLSSHHPYPIPAQYKGKFPKGNAQIHESIGYTDFALKRFFETASKQAWFKNTLFVITADHTQMNTEPCYATPTGAYRVPFLFYHADNQVLSLVKSKVNTLKICQHTDILPTILDFLSIDQKQVLPFGESIFEKNAGTAMHFNSGVFTLISENNYVEMNLDRQSKTFNLKTNLPRKNDENEISQLKAYIQFYRNGLIENSWIK